MASEKNGAEVRTSEVINLTIGRVTNDELEQAVAVWFKDEDEVTGTTVGPVWLQVGGSTPNDDTDPMPRDGKLVPFAKSDSVGEWFPVTMAEELAKELDVPLVRS